MSSTNFNTADRLIRMARKDAGLLQEGDDPSSEQVADGIDRLNDIINVQQTAGLKLWLQSDLNVPLVQGQGIYDIGPGGDVDMTKPMRVLDSGYYLDQFSNLRPLYMMAIGEYRQLSNPTQQGAITNYVVAKLQAILQVTLWLIPDYTAALGQCHLFIQQQVANFIGVTDATNFPNEWFIFLRWTLADELAIGQPESIMAKCALNAEKYRIMLEDWDVEDASTTFTPDTRMSGLTGRFR